jgi:hypothetical protein
MFGWAWLGLCMAFGVHVFDEAATGFLDIYNPAVERIRESYPFLPVPTFSFGVWLGLLVFAVGALTALSPLAFRGRWGIIPLAYPFAVIMLLNGLGHIAWSVYVGEAMPGVYSSPLLLAGSLFLLARLGRRTDRELPEGGLDVCP